MIYIRTVKNMAATRSAAPRLNFNAYDIDDYAEPSPYIVTFFRRSKDIDRLTVRWARPKRTDGVVMAHSQSAEVHNVVAVAFYPVKLMQMRDDRQDYDYRDVYVMSVWSWDKDIDNTVLVGHNLLYTGRYNMYADSDPGQLFPVDPEKLNVKYCMRFSQAEVDRSLTENLWAQFGWNIARHAKGYVVISMNDRTEAIQAPIKVIGAAEISALLGYTANETDVEHIKNWKCSICRDGIQENRKLVADHNADKDEKGNPILHVFHKKCLNRWIVQRSDCSEQCPLCKGQLSLKALSKVWSPGNTTLSGHMGVNPYMVMQSLFLRSHLIN